MQLRIYRTIDPRHSVLRLRHRDDRYDQAGRPRSTTQRARHPTSRSLLERGTIHRPAIHQSPVIAQQLRQVAQLCGDAHLSNFGAFASPERQLVWLCAARAAAACRWAMPPPRESPRRFVVVGRWVPGEERTPGSSTAAVPAVDAMEAEPCPHPAGRRRQSRNTPARMNTVTADLRTDRWSNRIVTSPGPLSPVTLDRSADDSGEAPVGSVELVIAQFL